MSTTAQRLGLGIAGFALLLILWQAVSSSPAAQGSLPGVGETAVRVAALLGEGSTWVQIGATLWVAVAGLFAGVAGGVLLGLLIGLSKTAMHATRFLLDFLRPIPAIVILPLAMLVFGPTSQMAIFLVFFACVLPTAAQTAAGVENVDPVSIDTARSFGLRRPEILWRVVLPSASPFIGTAVRMCAPVTLIIVIIAGLLGGAPGLGRELALAQMTGRFTDLIAYVLILGALGVIVQGGSETVERRLLHWHTSFRTEKHS